MKTRGFLSLLILSALALPQVASALDGVYLGAQAGFVSPTGNGASAYKNAVGFGIDLGLRTNPILDLMLGFQYSAHSENVPGVGDLTSFRQSLTAEIHVARFNDFDVTLGGGPGFYIYKAGGTSDTKFGLNFGGAIDMLVNDTLNVGVGTRYHAVFGTTGTQGGFFTVQMRIGYLFTTE